MSSLPLVAMATEEAGAPPVLERLPYRNPGLTVDLGVGLWALPLPMDYDGDGDLDLVVVTPDIPSNGAYFFENPDGSAFPTFRPGRWIAEGPRNATVSYPEGVPMVTTPGEVYPDFRETQFAEPQPIPAALDTTNLRPRANQWKYVDYDGDGLMDVVIGLGDWSDYGWDDAYNVWGNWTNGPLHGYVYVALNVGSKEAPEYATPEKVLAGGRPVDVFGAPSPNFADFDGDGDLDLICGEFLDGFTYFQNMGTRTAPEYAAAVPLTYQGVPLRMDLQMLQVLALDWDGDGDVDLIVGQEDGRVAWLEHTGGVEDGMPQFLPPRFFQQEAEYLKVGALSTPFAYDWDNDGDLDLIVGDTAGYISFVENLDGGDPPAWAAPVYLKADGEVIRIQAGPNGSIQGPAEAKWGYTVLNVADWNHNGLPDIVINSIWGEVLWYENAGTLETPKLLAAKPVEVDWEGYTPKPEWLWWNPRGRQLVTQWRTTPCVYDLNGDGLNDLIMLDTEGYLVYFERFRKGGLLRLRAPQRVFLDEHGDPLRLNERRAGGSGRRKFVLCDWDGDGRVDLLINSKNIDFYRNVSEQDGMYRFKNQGMVDTRILAGHTTSPAIVDWNGDGVPDLLIGAEDGFFYYMHNPR